MSLFNMKGEYDADDIMNNAKKDDDEGGEGTHTGDHNHAPVTKKKNFNK